MLAGSDEAQNSRTPLQLLTSASSAQLSRSFTLALFRLLCQYTGEFTRFGLASKSPVYATRGHGSLERRARAQLEVERAAACCSRVQRIRYRVRTGCCAVLDFLRERRDCVQIPHFTGDGWFAWWIEDLKLCKSGSSESESRYVSQSTGIGDSDR